MHTEQRQITHVRHSDKNADFYQLASFMVHLGHEFWGLISIAPHIDLLNDIGYALLL